MEKWYGLYHPASGKYISNFFCNYTNKHYTFHLANDIQDIRVWLNKASSEEQLKRMFNNPEDAPLEVREVKRTYKTYRGI